MNEAKRLTEADITALIESYQFHTQGTLTICIIHLTNGALVTGESRPLSDANFDEQRGKDAAYRKARDKIWELEGYAVRRDIDALLKNPPLTPAIDPTDVERAHAIAWIKSNAPKIASILRGEPDLETEHEHNPFLRESEVQVKRDRLAADLTEIASKLA